MRVRADLVGAFFTVAALYVLVRPRSAAVDLVEAVTKGVSAIVRRAADLGG